MAISAFLFPSLLLTLFVRSSQSWTQTKYPPFDSKWYINEVSWLATLPARPTGSEAHNQLIDHIESNLKSLGLEVYSDTIDFTFQDPPLPDISLNAVGKSINVASFVPYSGTTGDEGVTAPLVQISIPSAGAQPDWTAAANSIALVNITNSPLDVNALNPTYAGSPPFPEFAGIPSFAAERSIPDLTGAVEAGVQGIIYTWSNISSELAGGQYAPFKLLPQARSVPAVFVQDPSHVAFLQRSAERNAPATIKLPGRFSEGMTSRTLWTVIRGSETPDESVLLTTHTDGTNVIEENGHVALLAAAQHYITYPPKRSVVLVFASGHLRYPALGVGQGRAVTRWLDTHPDLWNGLTAPGMVGPTGAMKAVFSTCVEHLGAIHYEEEPQQNRYERTMAMEPELLYASTPALAHVLLQNYAGAEQDVTRVLDPNAGMPQVGEGLSTLQKGIPEIALVTAPGYLLKVFPTWFDQRKLVDFGVVKKQTESFLKVWDIVDSMGTEDIAR